MNKTTINVKELMLLLDKTPNDQVILLKGSHGIGKSSILSSYYEAKGMKVVTFFLGQMSDPGDLIGLPNKVGDKTEFLPPTWFPTDGEPIVLFLDELNRARPELLQAVMDLVLNKQLAGKRLPSGSIIVAAVNDGDEYMVNDLDPALISRFNVYTFCPSPMEWLSWARDSGVDKRVISFLEQNSSWLDGDPDLKEQPEGLVKTPDRRAWKKVSDFIVGNDHLTGIDRIIISGIVGQRAATRFYSSVSYQSDVTVSMLLDDFDNVAPKVVTMKAGKMATLIQGMVNNLCNVNVKAEAEDNAIAFVDYLLANDRKDLLCLLNNCWEKKTDILDSKYPDLADRLFCVKAELE